jgi:hypothetical protein
LHLLSKRGARVKKAAEMSPCLLSISELNFASFYFNNLLFALSGVPSE